MSLFLDQPHCKSKFKLWIYTKCSELKSCFLWPCVCNPMILVAEVGPFPKPDYLLYWPDAPGYTPWCYGQPEILDYGMYPSDTLSQRLFFLALYFVASLDGKVIVWYLQYVQTWSSTSICPSGCIMEGSADTQLNCDHWKIKESSHEIRYRCRKILSVRLSGLKHQCP